MSDKNPIQFYLGDEHIILSEQSPTQTLLQFLRQHKRLTGTKEGCAEGDCGACTLVIGELKNQSVEFRAVNSCILPISLLDGKQIITVEHLAKTPNELHPVQKAFVEQHASQCGFCTPGFVMSSYALYLNQFSNHLKALDEPQQIQELNRIYAGNLCRCTGYGAILDAGRQIIRDAQTEALRTEYQHWLAHLQSLRLHDNLKKKTLKTSDQQFFQPRSIKSLIKVLDQNPNSTIIAGATDIGLWLTKQRKKIPSLVSLGKIPELKKIETDEQRIKLFSNVTYSEALPVLSEKIPEFKEYLERHSSEQIRNIATIIGNIGNGSPIGDMPPPLIALNSTLSLGSVKGRRKLPLENFFIDYGKQDIAHNEFIESVEFSLPTEQQIFRVYKISKRLQQDISALSAAFLLELENNHVKTLRICYGGMAGIPKRASHCEQLFIGKPWTSENIEIACEMLTQDFTPMSDQRASSDYRMQVAQNLLRKFFMESTSNPKGSLDSIAIQVLNTGEVKYA